MQEQIKRSPLLFPTLDILNVHLDINDYTLNDFVVHDYQSCDPLIMKMRP